MSDLFIQVSVLFFLIFIIWSLIHIIGVVADGKFMDWTDYFKKKWRMSNFVAGETIQALGTSAPEISISILGLYIFAENPALGLATIIGSAIFQITVVIGVPILFAPKSAKLDPKGLFRTALVYGVSVVLLTVFLLTENTLVWWELTILTIYHIAYVWFLIATHPKQQDEPEQELEADKPEGGIFLLDLLDKLLDKIPGPDGKLGFLGHVPFGFIITLIIIGIASYFFIDASVILATSIGVSSGFIALTILAGGSSVPELFSNIPLAKKGNIDQAIGNAFGSNTLDICISFAFVSIPYTLFINPNGISGEGVTEMILPLFFLFAYLFIVLGVFALSCFQTRKWQGWFLIALFGVFVVAAYFQKDILLCLGV